MATANRLAAETSPYLLRHAGNPVDWYPWGPEAFERAAAEDKPVFLSVGYSACHWCHVMERESFEDPETAALLNGSFVNVKVDREERPDVDAVYMDAVQAMTGRGGWPMSVFCFSDATPFYGGTYFPPDDHAGTPAFRTVLRAVIEAYTTKRGDLAEQGRRLVEAIRQAQSSQRSGSDVPADVPADALADAGTGLAALFDEENGGFGGAPKFPQPLLLEFLLSHRGATGDTTALHMVRRTLDAMLRGGIYDQVGGGFARYAVDAHWTVPHFEKMLSDNALLPPVYLHAWQVTGESEYRRAVTETLDYLLTGMRLPCGGFASSQDADTEHGEGRFYVWTPEELRAVLGDDLGARTARCFGVTPTGNFEGGRSVLTLADAGALTHAERSDVRGRLLAARSQRVPPARDDKVLASWNGLVLGAFAEAGRVLGRGDYVEAARGVARHVLGEMATPDGRLLHTWRDARAHVPGFCDDYAAMAAGLLELYRATFEETWFAEARRLADLMGTLFTDPAGGFFLTAHDADGLVVRPKDLMDGALPAANSLGAEVFARLHLYTGEARYREQAEGALAAVGDLLGRAPQAFGRALRAHARLPADPRGGAGVGPGGPPLLDVLDGRYRPRVVVAAGDTAGGLVPLLAGRATVGDRATAYVCRDFACQAPVTEPEALEAALRPAS